MFERFGRTSQPTSLIHFMADDRVRTDHHALTALDAQYLIPNRNFQREVALFPLRVPVGKVPSIGKRGDGDVIAV
jgi:hypothetical protein